MQYELNVDTITVGEAAEAEAMSGPYGATLMGVDFRLPTAAALLALYYICERRAHPDEAPAALMQRALALPLLTTAITLVGNGGPA